MAVIDPANSAKVPTLIEAVNASLSLRTVRGGKAARSGLLSVLRESIGSSARIHQRKILSDITFTMHAGERIGLIGANGAGKSSLLMMLNGALKHTEGQLSIHGRTHALMNVRLGMKPRATGIENIYLNGFRLGYKSNDIKDLVDNISDFSELGDQIREPVHTYSAGMQLRLAFAIATSITPDILLMDEWIGAGDRKFRARASERLNSVLESSRGLVIASHNEGLIRSLCTKVLLLDKGRVRFFGDIDEGYKLFNDFEDGLETSIFD